MWTCLTDPRSSALLRRLTLVLALFFLPDAAPAGPVILTVGEDGTHQANATQYDIDALRALGTTEIVTDTPWTDGQITFTGVLMRDLLADAKVEGVTLKAVALNDYSVEIPVQDIHDYDVILAYQRDGTDLTVRDRGPLWVIYPWTDHPRLKTEHYYARSIWQLKALDMLRK